MPELQEGLKMAGYISVTEIFECTNCGHKIEGCMMIEENESYHYLPIREISKHEDDHGGCSWKIYFKLKGT